MNKKHLRKQFYQLIVSQLMYDSYGAEAYAIHVSENLQKPHKADNALFNLVKPLLLSSQKADTVIDSTSTHWRKVVTAQTEKQIESEQITHSTTEKSTEAVKDDDRCEPNSEQNKTNNEQESPEKPEIEVMEETTAVPAAVESVEISDVEKPRSAHSSRNKVSVCNLCQLVLDNSSSLYEHLIDEHMIETDSGCVCKHCNKAVKNKYILNAHLKTHSDVHHILCPDCGKGFKRTTDYKDHREKVHENNVYSCPDCTNTYSLLRSLQKHTNEVHKKPGRHICSCCGKQFNSSNQLKMHEMVYHTKEKPHKCVVCGTSFRSSGHLHNHMLLHRGVKEFKCGLCYHRVYQKGNMKSHMKTHCPAGEIFWCNDCKQAWPSNDELQAHVKTCDGKQPVPPPSEQPVIVALQPKEGASDGGRKRTVLLTNENSSKRMKLEDGVTIMLKPSQLMDFSEAVNRTAAVDLSAHLKSNEGKGEFAPVNTAARNSAASPVTGSQKYSCAAVNEIGFDSSAQSQEKCVKPQVYQLPETVKNPSTASEIALPNSNKLNTSERNLEKRADVSNPPSQSKGSKTDKSAQPKQNIGKDVSANKVTQPKQNIAENVSANESAQRKQSIVENVSRNISVQRKQNIGKDVSANKLTQPKQNIVSAAGEAAESSRTRILVSHNGKELELILAGNQDLENVEQLVQHLVESGNL